MPIEPAILQKFRDHVEINHHDAGAVLDDEIDSLLGFQGTLTTTTREAVPGGSWRSETSSYRNVTELRLQELTSSMLNFHSRIFSHAKRPGADQVCVRIVNSEYGSPFMESTAGFYFIVVPWGYLKSVENIWRMHGRLRGIGRSMPVPNKPCVMTDDLGGASIERALRGEFREASTAIDQILDDQIWRAAWSGSYVYPEAMMANFARMAVESRKGFYSTGDQDSEKFRMQSTSQSKWLTRCVLAYLVMHEMTHVLFRYETGGDKPNANSMEIEIACDLFATMYYPSFVLNDASHWELDVQAEQQFLVASFAFFTATEVWETAGLAIMHANTKGDNGPVDSHAARRLGEIQDRAKAHFTSLSKSVERDPLLRLGPRRIACEMQALVVGVQMVAARLIKQEQTTFANHFNHWLAELK